MTEHTTPAISVRGLRRSYGKPAYEAVRGIDLDVATGSITALLGTNGAGKTSTLEVIEGLAAPTAGEVQVLGLHPLRDRAEVRRRTGVLLQTSGFAGDLTVRETVQMWAATVSHPRPVDDALGALRLDHRADTRMAALSGGERRRVDLACALLGHPEVVFLDEPTTGLDPESRRDVWGLVRDLRAGGATVLVTTHYLDEAESLADQVEIMHAGLIARSGTTEEIVADHPATISFRRDDARALPDSLGALAEDPADTTTVLRTHDLQETLTLLLDWARTHGVALEHLQARSASLEAVFLDVAGHPAAGDPADEVEDSSGDLAGVA